MAKQKKYEFTGEFKSLSRNEKLHQIRALIDIPEQNVKAGDVGGWIQKQLNLPHDNKAWVADNAMVYGNAVIKDSSRVEKNAVVNGRAEIFDSSLITGKAVVENNAKVGSSTIRADVEIGDFVEVLRSRIGGDTKVMGKTTIKNSHVTTKESVIEGNVVIINSKIGGIQYVIKDNSRIVESIIGRGYMSKTVTISENARIFKSEIISTRDIFIGEHATISDGVYIIGHDIMIKGMATIKGHVQIGLKTTIDDLVCIEGGSKKTRRTSSLFGKVIAGDVLISM